MLRRLLCIVAAALLAGCGLTDADNTGSTVETDQNKHSNLNFTDVKINEFKPGSGEWYELEYKLKDIEDEGESLLREVLGELNEELVPEKTHFFYTVYDEKGMPAERESYSLAERIADSDFSKKDADLVLYDNGTVHVEINSAGQVNYWRPDDAVTASGEDPEFPIYFFSYGNGTTYDLKNTPANFDKKFKVGNVEQSVGEVTERLKNVLENSDVFKSDLVTLTPKSVDIMKYESGSYGYWLNFGYEYDGVPILYHTWYADSQQSSNYAVINGLGLYAGTFSDNGLDGMWSIGGFQLLKPEVRKINEIISYDAACDIVSGLLTDKHVFDVNRVYLQYAEITDISGPGNGAEVVPVWIFEITNLNRSDWGAMYVIIKAETGEVMLYHT